MWLFTRSVCINLAIFAQFFSSKLYEYSTIVIRRVFLVFVLLDHILELSTGWVRPMPNNFTTSRLIGRHQCVRCIDSELSFFLSLLFAILYMLVKILIIIFLIICVLPVIGDIKLVSYTLAPCKAGRAFGSQ